MDFLHQSFGARKGNAAAHEELKKVNDVINCPGIAVKSVTAYGPALSCRQPKHKFLVIQREGKCSRTRRVEQIYRCDELGVRGLLLRAHL